MADLKESYLNARVPADLLRELDARAAELGLGRSEMLRMILTWWLLGKRGQLPRGKDAP